MAGPPTGRKVPLNYRQDPESVQSRIGVYSRRPEVVIPSLAPGMLDSHFGYPLASTDSDATTKPPNDVHTHYESSSAPLFPKNSDFPEFNFTNAYDSPVWKHFQNSWREFEEFEWHLRGATLLFFDWLANIYRLWLFAAWYIFTSAFQAFLDKILIPQLSAIWFAMVPILRNLAPIWVLSIVDLALEANELSVELARRTDNRPLMGGRTHMRAFP